MNAQKKRVVIFTKEPLSEERIYAILQLQKEPILEIVGVFIERSMHLPPLQFFLKTLTRIRNGYVYLPEFVKNLIEIVFTSIKNGKEGINWKQFLESAKIKVFVVTNVEHEDVLRQIKKLKPDLGIIVGHRILSSNVFSIPKLGTINVHHGILPRYAGSHSTFWALVEGAKEVGLTIHKVSEKVDQGDVLYIQKIPVGKIKNADRLYEQVKKHVPDALRKAVVGYFRGKIHFIKQDHTQKRYWKPPTFSERLRYRKYL